MSTNTLNLLIKFNKVSHHYFLAFNPPTNPHNNFHFFHIQFLFCLLFNAQHVHHLTPYSIADLPHYCKTLLQKFRILLHYINCMWSSSVSTIFYALNRFRTNFLTSSEFLNFNTIGSHFK